MARVSDDFYPTDAASWTSHIPICSYNSLFMGALIQVRRTQERRNAFNCTVCCDQGQATCRRLKVLTSSLRLAGALDQSSSRRTRACVMLVRDGHAVRLFLYIKAPVHMLYLQSGQGWGCWGRTWVCRSHIAKQVWSGGSLLALH